MIRRRKYEAENRDRRPKGRKKDEDDNNKWWNEYRALADKTQETIGDLKRENATLKARVVELQKRDAVKSTLVNQIANLAGKLSPACLIALAIFYSGLDLTAASYDVKEFLRSEPVNTALAWLLPNGIAAAIATLIHSSKGSAVAFAVLIWLVFFGGLYISMN